MMVFTVDCPALTAGERMERNANSDPSNSKSEVLKMIEFFETKAITDMMSENSLSRNTINK